MTQPQPNRLGLRPFPGEPVVPAWSPRPWPEVASALLRGIGDVGPRPVIVAVDGRSGSGKTTAAERLAACVPGAVVVHTDDVAWWESFFGWDGLMASGVLLPARRGGAVVFRPPAWERRGRPGAIEVPAGTPMVVVEGVGAGRRSLATLLDRVVWVQSDHGEATRRGIARDGGTPEAVAFWQEWSAEEEPFLALDRPWERADLIVCGTPDLVATPHGAEEALIAVHGADDGPSCRC